MIARTIGAPLSVVAAMTPGEYEGWRAHFRRFPHAETLIGMLWLSVMRGLGNTSATSSDVGYWIEPPEQRRQREEDEAKQKRRNRAAITEAAYLRSKQQAEDG